MTILHEDTEQIKNRVILLVDVDSFEFQVWSKKKRPDLLRKNVPVVVVNTSDKILSLNAAAKRVGIKRKDESGRGLQSLSTAQQICDDANVKLEVIPTDLRFERTDTFLPIRRSHGLTALTLQFVQEQFPSAILERNGSDEHFIDISQEVDRLQNLPQRGIKSLSTRPWLPPLESTYHLSSLTKENTDNYYLNDPVIVMATEHEEYSGAALFSRIRTMPRDPASKTQDARQLHFTESRLFYGAMIAHQLKTFIFDKTGYVLSAGVGENKLQAKMACQLNQPDGISIITNPGFQRLANSTFFLKDMPGFGGIQGVKLQKRLNEIDFVGYKTIGRILTAPKQPIIEYSRDLAEMENEDVETYVANLLTKCRGIDESAVIQKTENDNMSVTASFTGPRCLDSFEKLICGLAQDFKDRLKYFGIKTGVISLKLLNFNDNSLAHEGDDTDDSIPHQMVIENEEACARRLASWIWNYIKRRRFPFTRIDKIKITIKKGNSLLDLAAS